MEEELLNNMQYYVHLRNQLDDMKQELNTKIEHVMQQLQTYCNHEWERCIGMEECHTVYICKKCRNYK